MQITRRRFATATAGAAMAQARAQTFPSKPVTLVVGFGAGGVRAISSPSDAMLAHLVDCIGSERFGPALAAYLHWLCGADHFAAFRLGRDELLEIAACCVQPERTARDRVESYVNQGLWKHDPAMSEAQRRIDTASPTLIHVDFSDRGYEELRPRVYPHVTDRILVCGRSGNGAFGLSVLRGNAHSPFPHEAMDNWVAPRNCWWRWWRSTPRCCSANPMRQWLWRRCRKSNLALRLLGTLPRREAEVCARILYGLSSIGIALDLTVSEETVKTYRKRAYQRRLAIGSERELLTWYLSHWSYWRAGSFQTAASTALH